ncbi:MAG: protein phosphatase CheZ [Pseudolabrys sp.]
MSISSKRPSDGTRGRRTRRCGGKYGNGDPENSGVSGGYRRLRTRPRLCPQHDYHHRLTQDVQDHVVRIYEACNFQDLAGQRIGKVITMLIMLEERLVAMIQRHGGVSAPPTQALRPSPPTVLINGPRLDGAAGHASQLDIDTMFA